MEKISWIDCTKKEGVLQRVKEKEISYTQKKRRKAIWIGHILRRNLFLKHGIEGNIEETERRGRTRK
jgi:hypothetical protein